MSSKFPAEVVYAFDETTMSSCSRRSHLLQGKISVDNHTVFEIFIEHALGVVQQIYIPEGVLLCRGQLIHLHEHLLVVQSIELFQDT